MREGATIGQLATWREAMGLENTAAQAVETMLNHIFSYIDFATLGRVAESPYHPDRKFKSAVESKSLVELINSSGFEIFAQTSAAIYREAGYCGQAFINFTNKVILISSKGTDFSNTGSQNVKLIAYLKMLAVDSNLLPILEFIQGMKYTGDELKYKGKKIIELINEGFECFCVGHSLGGPLAQIQQAMICAEYYEGYKKLPDVYALTYDSIGAGDFLKLYAPTLAQHIAQHSLIFALAPNLFNKINNQLGRVVFLGAGPESDISEIHDPNVYSYGKIVDFLTWVVKGSITLTKEALKDILELDKHRLEKFYDGHIDYHVVRVEESFTTKFPFPIKLLSTIGGWWYWVKQGFVSEKLVAFVNTLKEDFSNPAEVRTTTEILPQQEEDTNFEDEAIDGIANFLAEIIGDTAQHLIEHSPPSLSSLSNEVLTPSNFSSELEDSDSESKGSEGTDEDGSDLEEVLITTPNNASIVENKPKVVNDCGNTTEEECTTITKSEGFASFSLGKGLSSSVSTPVLPGAVSNNMKTKLGLMYRGKENAPSSLSTSNLHTPEDNNATVRNLTSTEWEGGPSASASASASTATLGSEREGSLSTANLFVSSTSEATLSNTCQNFEALRFIFLASKESGRKVYDSSDCSVDAFTTGENECSSPSSDSTAEAY